MKWILKMTNLSIGKSETFWQNAFNRGIAAIKFTPEKTKHESNKVR